MISEEMKLGALLERFQQDIADEYCFQGTDLKISNPQILIWYRERDRRPWHVDHALCSAEIEFLKEVYLLIGFMVRNPTAKSSEWHAHQLIDGGPYWYQLFTSPPTREQALYRLKRFSDEARAGIERYAYFNDDIAWSKLFVGVQK